VAKVEGAVARYLLLDTTRAYALEKRYESSERERIARRHAQYYRDLFETGGSRMGAAAHGRMAGRLRPKIDNLRACARLGLFAGRR